MVRDIFAERLAGVGTWHAPKNLASCGIHDGEHILLGCLLLIRSFVLRRRTCDDLAVAGHKSERISIWTEAVTRKFIPIFSVRTPDHNGQPTAYSRANEQQICRLEQPIERSKE